MDPVALPRSVDISLSTGITVVWDDRNSSHYPIRYLREHCPCATCTGAHGTAPVPAPAPSSGLLPVYKPIGATLLSAEPVGRYGLQLRFSDGHDTGIFTWEYLRAIAPPQAQKA